MADLVARTQRVDGDLDLPSFAGHDGVLFVRDDVGLAGQGVALRGPTDEVVEALAVMDVDDEVGVPGCGPVAFAALPFQPGAAAELVVPAQVVGRDPDGTRWVTNVGVAPLPDGLDSSPVRINGDTPVEPAMPSRFEVVSSRPPAEWCEAVATATARIRAGALDKVVLAREVVVTADAPIPVGHLLARLRGAYPGCFLYSIDGFVGASPELLVSRHGDIVRAQPMAGTAPRRGDPAADARLAAGLLASPSYRHEHQVTIDMVHDTLLAFCSYLDYEPEPSVVALANVAHLASKVEGRLSQPAASVLELVAALHPTPAVCGRPQAAALAVIAELEGLGRGRYCGNVGWVDAHGNGQWAVSIRCAEIDGPVARLYGGNGIVAGSDPAVELAETRAKLEAMLQALIRP